MNAEDKIRKYLSSGLLKKNSVVLSSFVSVLNSHLSYFSLQFRPSKDSGACKSNARCVFIKRDKFYLLNGLLSNFVLTFSKELARSI